MDTSVLTNIDRLHNVTKAILYFNLINCTTVVRVNGSDMILRFVPAKDREIFFECFKYDDFFLH